MSRTGPHSERISLLIEIDQHDRAIAEILAARDDIRSANQAAREQIHRLKAERDALLQAQKVLKRLQKQREIDLSRTEEKLARVSTFEHVKTARELEAAKHEVEVLRKKKDELEEAILLGLDEEDERADEKARLDRVIQDALTAYEREKGPWRKQYDRFSEELEKHREGRKDCLSRMDPELKSIYEPLIKRYGDRAATTVIDDRCIPCRLHVPSQHVIDVLLGKTLHICQHCERLILPEENPVTE